MNWGRFFALFYILIWPALFIAATCSGAELEWQPALGAFDTSRPVPIALGIAINRKVPWGGYPQPRFKYGIGFWGDPAADRKGGFHLDYNIGVRVGDSVYAEGYVGPMFVFPTDAYISSVFSFNSEIGVGIVDSDGWRFGFGLRHMSNAGIVEPNRGRDWFYLKIGVPL
jgi:hypothetical protein